MNEFDLGRMQAKMMKEQYPVGTRIYLNSMGDDPRPLPPGSRGTVRNVDDMGTVHVDWDNGRSLGLICGEDSFRKLSDEELAEEENNLCQTM